MPTVELCCQFGAGLSALLWHNTFSQQRINHLLIVCFREKRGDAVGDLGTDIWHAQQQQRVRVANGLQAAKSTRQSFGRFLANLQNAERKQQALQRHHPATVDSFKQVFRPACRDLARPYRLRRTAIAGIGLLLHA
ncbi:MAG: hypothetical protein BWZ07_02135 [Alphaproteobacteria bacterium ADurb.BinA280]|nr:MAG: hypothetical protein BWZ07_02135 [Alphaproteobacteria bacterium ADurb.BinA280]